MVKETKELKKIYPNFFHVTYLAYFVHNCAMRIRAFYVSVDICISSIKAITIKNKRIYSLFSVFGKPPDVIVTRWSSWLKAAIYYSDSFIIIKKLVNDLPDEGILIKRAKEAINKINLFSDLVDLTTNYSCLIKVLIKFEASELNMEQGYQIIIRLNFESDLVKLKEYIFKRLSENEIQDLLSFKIEMISPTTYALL